MLKAVHLRLLLPDSVVSQPDLDILSYRLVDLAVAGNEAQLAQLLRNEARNVVFRLDLNGLHVPLYLDLVQVLVDEEIDGEVLVRLSEESSTSKMLRKRPLRELPSKVFSVIWKTGSL